MVQQIRECEVTYVNARDFECYLCSQIYLIAENLPEITVTARGSGESCETGTYVPMFSNLRWARALTLLS